MNKLIKPITILMALTIPFIASANVQLKQINEYEVVVTYNAAEAATEEGRVELERQVRVEAEKICGPQNLSRTGDMRRWLQNRDCFQKIVADALYSINTTSKSAS